MIEPAVLGAVKIILNEGAAALVADCPAGMEPLKEIEHCRIPATFVQLGVPLMPCIEDTLENDVPAGRRSFTVNDVPDATPPLLPSAIVYSICPPVSTVAEPVLEIVTLTGEFTVVAALAQFALVQEGPGVGGELPPVESTDA